MLRYHNFFFSFILMRIINYLHCKKPPYLFISSSHPSFCLLSVLSRKIKLSVRAAPVMTAPALLLLLASLLAPAAPWCIPAGGVGEYSTKCMESSSVGRWTLESSSQLYFQMRSRVRGLLRAVPVLRRQRQPDPRAPGHLRAGRVLLCVRLLPLRQVTLSQCAVSSVWDQQTHIKSVHEGQKFPCKFTHKGSLQRHEHMFV